jgi:hypothetical protein
VVETHAHRAGFQVATADDEDCVDAGLPGVGVFAMKGALLKSSSVPGKDLEGHRNSCPPERVSFVVILGQ